MEHLQHEQSQCQSYSSLSLKQHQHRGTNHPMVEITLQSLQGFGIKVASNHCSANSNHRNNHNNQNHSYNHNPRIPKVTAAVAFSGSAADMEIGSSFVCPKTGRLMVESHPATTLPRRTTTSGTTTFTASASTSTSNTVTISQPLMAHWNHSSRANGGPLNEYNTASTAISLFHTNHETNENDHHGAADSPHASIYLPPQDPRLPAMSIAVSNRDGKILHQSATSTTCAGCSSSIGSQCQCKYHQDIDRYCDNTDAKTHDVNASRSGACSATVGFKTTTKTSSLSTAVPSLMAHSDVSSTCPASSDVSETATITACTNVKHIDDDIHHDIYDDDDMDPVATAIWNPSPETGAAAVMPEIIEMYVSIKVDSEALFQHGNRYNKKKQRKNATTGATSALDHDGSSRSMTTGSNHHHDALDQSGSHHRSTTSTNAGIGGGLRDLLDRSIQSVRTITQSSSASSSPTSTSQEARGNKTVFLEDVHGTSYDEIERNDLDDDDACHTTTTDIGDDDDNTLPIATDTQCMYQVGLAYLVLFGNDGGSTLMDLPLKKLAAPTTNSTNASSSSSLDDLVVLYPDASLRVRVDVYPTGKKKSPPPPPTLYTSISILEQATQLHQSNVLEPILRQLQLAEDFKARRRMEQNKNKTNADAVNGDNNNSLVERSRPYCGRLADTTGSSSFLCGVVDLLTRCEDRTDDDENDNVNHPYMDRAYSMDSTLDTSPSMRLW